MKYLSFVFTFVFTCHIVSLVGNEQVECAKKFFYEQELGKAFVSFLELLAKVPYKPTSLPSAHFREVQELYLDPSAATPQQTAIKVLKKYGRGPQEPDVSFIVAAAYANLGFYDKFFDQFYGAYEKQPDHYLAYKAKANLYIKLFEMAPTPQQKEELRQSIIENLQKSMERNPNDQGLYAMMLSFAPFQKRKEIVSQTINTLIQRDVQVARHDIDFFIKNALSIQDYALARRFVQKAKEWYPYSRTINEAEKFLGDQNGTKNPR